MTRILLIDDDAAVRRLIGYALSDEGYQVDEAQDGQAALDLVSKHRPRPHIIILDMKMPRMDGWQFATIYRERYGHDTPIIVLTAAQDTASRAADVKTAIYLSKPFDLDTLLRLVADVAKGLPAEQPERARTMFDNPANYITDDNR